MRGPFLFFLERVFAMENLDKVLAELCEKLGVGSEGLVKWLTDGGLQSYAKLQADSFLADGFIRLALVAILVGTAIWGWKYLHSDSAPEYGYEVIVIAIIVELVFAFAFAIMAIGAFEQSFFWYTNPDGMFIRLALEMLS